MARLQILQLPGPADEYPFALVFDQWDSDPQVIREVLEHFKAGTGARTVMVFRESVDVV